MEILGLAITILAGILTYQAWKNGRWMKQSHENTLSLLERIDRGQEEARKEMAEARKEMAEARKEMAEARKEMAEAFERIARLIIDEGKRTREAIIK